MDCFKKEVFVSMKGQCMAVLSVGQWCSQTLNSSEHKLATCCARSLEGGSDLVCIMLSLSALGE